MPFLPDETRSIRRTMRDLVALSALPAIWVGQRPLQVAESLADLLLNTLRLDFVYLRLRGPANGHALEVARTGHRPTAVSQAEEIGRALVPWLESADLNSSPSLPNPVGSGTVQVVRIPLGWEADVGILVAGSQQTGFPTEEDRLLLSVGANQATAVLHRLAAEEALRNSEWRFRGTFENAALGIAQTDSNGRILSVNKTFCGIVGYTREELLERTFQDVTHPEDMPANQEQFIRLMRGELASFSREKRYVRKDGSPVQVEVTVSLQRDATGSPVYAIAIVEDISERKRLVEELRKAKETAEAANRAKDEFLANVSHEIRTPFGAILGMTELVLDTPLTEDQRQCLTTVKSAADSLLGVINDLLDYSKIEAGKLELDSAAFSLQVVLGDTLRALAGRAHKKGLELACQVQPNVPDALIGDAGRLRQVLLNLVGNAIKFTEQGEVVIAVGRTSGPSVRYDGPEVRPTEVCLCFAVSDTGIGISTGKQETIFRAFEQEDTSTTRRYGGTGLGLTIAAQLAALMGGKITVESELARGSTFAFTARFGRQANPPVLSVARPPISLQNLPVLIVDDNATNRRILEEWVRGWQMKPLAVGDGLAALDALWHWAACGLPYALVLLDARMPDTDGLALAAKIRQRAELSDPRIILLTSGDRPGDLARSNELRIDAYLFKPVSQDELLETIYRVMNRATGDTSPTAQPAQALLQNGVSLRILVAEDNEFNTRHLERLLTGCGHSVRLANDGHEALALLGTRGERTDDRGQTSEAGSARSSVFDLLLLDLHMPELDGFQVVQAIRGRERIVGGHLPVIALTARSRKEDRERCLAAGMDDFLAKPVRTADLFAAIERAVSVSGVSRQEAGDGTSFLTSAVLLAASGNDEEGLRGMCEDFRTFAPPRVTEVKDALQNQDAPRLREAAHKLCGLLSAFSTAAGNTAAELEDQAARGQFDDARPLVARLDMMTQKLLSQMDTLTLEALVRQSEHSEPKS